LASVAYEPQLKAFLSFYISCTRTLLIIFH